MTNHKIHTISGQIDIPSSSSGFNALDQVVWSGSSVRDRPTFTPSNGDTTVHENDGQLSGGTPAAAVGLYNPDMAYGLEFFRHIGKKHSINLETYGNGRWIPASCFNGCGFEVDYQFPPNVSDGTNSLALKIARYALCFSHRTNDSWFQNYSINIPLADRSAKVGTRYYSLPSNDHRVQEIRALGKDYLFQGFSFNLTSDGGPGDIDSRVTIFNVKVGHKFSTVGPEYRMIPLRKRAYGHRNRDNEGFTDPFV